MSELYRLVISDIYKTHKGSIQDERKDITDAIAKLNSKLANARELLFDGKLDADDFSIMKRECEAKIKRLEIDLAEVKVQKSSAISLDNMLSNAIEALSNLKQIYNDSGVLRKREILGSIFRKKLRFDESEYRTARLNEAASLIYLINKSLGHKKTGNIMSHHNISRQVLRAGIEPALL